jgi:hypothetical protein
MSAQEHYPVLAAVAASLVQLIVARKHTHLLVAPAFQSLQEGGAVHLHLVHELE